MIGRIFAENLPKEFHRHRKSLIVKRAAVAQLVERNPPKVASEWTQAAEAKRKTALLLTIKIGIFGIIESMR